MGVNAFVPPSRLERSLLRFLDVLAEEGRECGSHQDAPNDDRIVDRTARSQGMRRVSQAGRIIALPRRDDRTQGFERRRELILEILDPFEQARRLIELVRIDKQRNEHRGRLSSPAVQSESDRVSSRTPDSAVGVRRSLAAARWRRLHGTARG